VTKKIFAILLVAVLVATIVPAAVFAKSPKTEFDLNGPHFNLNLIGKADGWNDKEVTNPDRHTMFVPMDTTNWEIELKKPNKVVNHGNVIGNNVTAFEQSFAIYMTQGGDDFAVVDGTAFDGDACELNLADGKYWVVVAAKAKPVANAPKIDGWAQIYDIGGALYYYLNLGTVTVSRKWDNATDLFFIDEEEASGATTGLPNPVNQNELGMWIFDYFNYLDDAEYTEFAYFWQLQNHGSKLIQVRFYPM
jgi:hypothetical protein